MQRKFLEDLGLEKEVIDKIMDENGKDINREKGKTEEFKTQLDTAKETLKSFEGIDVKELQGKIATLTSDLEKKDKDYQEKIADMEFNSLLDSAISSSGAKNSKAVKALIDIEALKSSKNQSDDIKKAIDTVKSENDYLFGSAEPIDSLVGNTNNGGTDQNSDVTKEAFAKMGYSERLKLKKNDPKKYDELKGE